MESRRGLVVFDLDGTLLRGPTVCEIVAESLGRTEQMASFEKLTSEIEITAAREEMAHWYRASSEVELLTCLDLAQRAPGAREGVALLRQADVVVGIASMTWHFAVERFARELGVDLVLATGLSPDGTIEHVWPHSKVAWLEGLAQAHGLPRERTAAVGDSAGDLPMLRAAGSRFFVGPVVPADLVCCHVPDGDIREIARVVLDGWQ